MTITDKQAMRTRIDARFRSGNSVPVERVAITASEWAELRAALEAAKAVRDSEMPASFADYVTREMPPGTVISRPLWWAPRLWRAAQSAAPSSAEQAGAQPVSVADELPAPSAPCLTPEPFGWAVLDKNGCTERVISRVHYEFACIEPSIRSEPDPKELLAYLDREYNGVAPHRILTLYTNRQPSSPATSAPAADERARFEAAAQGVDNDVHRYWFREGWQARAQSSAAPNHRDDSLGMVAPVSDYWFVHDATLGDGPLQRGTPSSDDVAYAYGMGKSIVRLYAAPVSAWDGEAVAFALMQGTKRLSVYNSRHEARDEAETYPENSAVTVVPLYTAPPTDAPRPVATIHECRDAGGCMCDWFSADDAAAIGRLPVGTKLYAGAPPADARDAADARRYRWITKRPHSTVSIQSHWGQPDFSAASCDLDAAIDRAMGGE